MREPLDVLVAVGASEHAAMDRILELALVDVQAYRFPVDVLGQARIAVTRQALGGFIHRGCWRFSLGKGRYRKQY